MKSKWITYFIPPSKAKQAVAENPGKAAPAGWKPGESQIVSITLRRKQMFKSCPIVKNQAFLHLFTNPKG